MVRAYVLAAFTLALTAGPGLASEDAAPSPASLATPVSLEAFLRALDEGRDPAASPSTADHSQFEALRREFASGPEVTQACLSCHNQASHQVMQSLHWTWEYDGGDPESELGKAHVFNSFCGNVASNEPRCTSCHIGYGWDDVREPAPTEETQVDCLICHDRSGQYTHLADGAGHPPLDPVRQGARTITGALATPVNLTEAAVSVGLPGTSNCLSCHAYGGGGDNVKHGDLSSALLDPAPEVDVHMSADGAGFTCTSCHVSESHIIDGSRYDVHASDPHHGEMTPGARRDVTTCQSCHSEAPHPTTVTGIRLNQHAERIACQTCHIPEYARGGVAALTRWDWSEAGTLRDGRPFSLDEYIQGNGEARHTYYSIKGSMEWGEDIVPSYAWFDGQLRYTTRALEIDPEGVTDVNHFSGDAEDPNSRIWPIRVVTGRQAYDTATNRFVATNVWGPTTTTAYWTNFNWNAAIRAAMDYLGEPYSGDYDFAETRMYWPITHMVAPAENALDCVSCHSDGGRMEGIEGVYVPSRDWQPATLLGLLLVAAAVLGVSGHAVVRAVARRSEGK
jgi:octaheme c-type cytochrome (tetrathionate reductase family)